MGIKERVNETVRFIEEQTRDMDMRQYEEFLEVLHFELASERELRDWLEP
nr:MAG TPA: hypothetical protein [Caudoviricetes sp.]